MEYTDAGWKMVVPAGHALGPGARAEFAAIAASAEGAAADPVEESCALLLPATAEIIRREEGAEPGGELRLAAMLAAGRAVPRLTVESVLSAGPSWLARGKGRFEVALATYAGERGHPDLAADAMERAAGYSQDPDARLLAFAALYAADAGDAPRAQALISRARHLQVEQVCMAWRPPRSDEMRSKGPPGAVAVSIVER